jgi:hypothetical protein
MGGQTPYGFRTEPAVMDGVRTKKFIADRDATKNVQLLFEMYAQPEVPLGVSRTFLCHCLLWSGKKEPVRGTPPRKNQTPRDRVRV